MAGWDITRTEDGDVLHVHPVNDWVEHDLDDEGGCVCLPSCQIEFHPELGDIHHWTHHALDGRPAANQARRDRA